jgi:hypothetical protein
MERATLLICSDIHYASDAEKERGRFELGAIDQPLIRLLIRFYRHYIWLRDPFAHNELLQHVLHPSLQPDLVICNGDYSCDSAFIGVADPASRESAQLCLGQFRARYGSSFHGVFGDHELGKISMAGGKGGLRLESWRVSRETLALKPLWQETLGKYRLIGITSSLVAMDIFQKEALPEEQAEWLELSREHLAAIDAAFGAVRPEEKVILFCHDPTALPALLEVPELKKRLPQIERTVIGHLHSELIIRQSRLLGGLPPITFCGAAVRRMSAALSKARHWKAFNLLLCPSLAGIEIERRGGFYTVELDLAAKIPAAWHFRPLPR